MKNTEYFTPEQIKNAQDLSDKAEAFLRSESATHYYSQRINNGVGNHSEAFIAGLKSIRQDSNRFID